MTCQIYLKAMYNGEATQYDTVRTTEICVANFINTLTTISPIIDVSEGYNPKWDFEHLNGTFSECKTSVRKHILLEFAKPDNTVSGITATKADYYIFISRGWNTKLGLEVGKVRYTPVHILKQFINDHKERLKPIKFEHDTNSQGSICYELNFRSLDKDTDGWIADVPIIWNGDKLIGYDLDTNKVLSVNRLYKK